NDFSYWIGTVFSLILQSAVFILKKKIEKVLSFLPAEIEIIRTNDSLKNNSCGKKKQKKE
ncbi:hypothetical protein EBB69_08805, partial [Lactobacillus delbrueckii]|uniref:hypothetical protein n=1 Tax=Lactobacillus delbrueckii TaxID=1584 RepID=UPI001C70559D